MTPAALTQVFESQGEIISVLGELGVIVLLFEIGLESDLGWRSFRTMLEAKSVMYGRDFRVISRWEPTSQRCHCPSTLFH